MTRSTGKPEGRGKLKAAGRDTARSMRARQQRGDTGTHAEALGLGRDEKYSSAFRSGDTRHIRVADPALWVGHRAASSGAEMRAGAGARTITLNAVHWGACPKAPLRRLCSGPPLPTQ